MSNCMLAQTLKVSKGSDCALLFHKRNFDVPVQPDMQIDVVLVTRAGTPFATGTAVPHPDSINFPDFLIVEWSNAVTATWPATNVTAQAKIIIDDRQQIIDLYNFDVQRSGFYE